MRHPGKSRHGQLAEIPVYHVIGGGGLKKEAVFVMTLIRKKLQSMVHILGYKLRLLDFGNILAVLNSSLG